MEGGIYVVGIGGLISILLTIIGYFLHYMVQDIRMMRGEVVEMKKDCTWLMADNKVLRALMQQQLQFLKSKLSKLEKDQKLNNHL